MSILSIFGELKIKLNDQFKRSILYAIGVYFFSWLILQIFFWIFAGLIWVISLIMGGKPFSLTPLLDGFTLFPYFPYCLTQSPTSRQGLSRLVKGARLRVWFRRDTRVQIPPSALVLKFKTFIYSFLLF